MAIFRHYFQNKQIAHMKTAENYAELSHAERMKVGAVLVKDNRIVATGYNGTISGADNTCELIVDGELVTREDVLHAEENVILFAAKDGRSTDGCTLYTTLSPCFKCSRMIAQCGIREVVYRDEYRDLSGVQLLDDNNVYCWRLNYDQE